MHFNWFSVDLTLIFTFWICEFNTINKQQFHNSLESASFSTTVNLRTLLNVIDLIWQIIEKNIFILLKISNNLNYIIIIILLISVTKQNINHFRLGRDLHCIVSYSSLFYLEGETFMRGFSADDVAVFVLGPYFYAFSCGVYLVGQTLFIALIFLLRPIL